MKNKPFIHRFTFALSGIYSAWRTEASFRFQSLAAACAMLILWYFQATALWWALFVLQCFAILASELMNTALEVLADRLHPDEHPMIKRAKDSAAGAVLVLCMSSIILMLIFLWEHS